MYLFSILSSTDPFQEADMKLLLLAVVVVAVGNA